MVEGSLTWVHEVRRRLKEPAPVRLPPDDLRQAAVLIPLYVEAGELWTILTRRSEELPHHRGQIAFPGGGQEEGEQVWDTALRETAEELGLDPGMILELGALDELSSPSGYRIVPCVGAVPTQPQTTPNEAEIAEVFSVPVLALADVRMVEERRVEIEGQSRDIRVYHVGGRQVWGLTARIIQRLLARLGVGPGGGA